MNEESKERVAQRVVKMGLKTVIYLTYGALVIGAYHLGSIIREPKVNFYGDIKSLSTTAVEPWVAPRTIDFLVTTKSGDKIEVVINGDNLKKQPEKEKIEGTVKKESFLGNIEADINFFAREYRRIIDSEDLTMDEFMKKYPKRFKFSSKESPQEEFCRFVFVLPKNNALCRESDL